jgi:hypothetical protein
VGAGHRFTPPQPQSAAASSSVRTHTILARRRAIGDQHVQSSEEHKVDDASSDISVGALHGVSAVCQVPARPAVSAAVDVECQHLSLGRKGLIIHLDARRNPLFWNMTSPRPQRLTIEWQRLPPIAASLNIGIEKRVLIWGYGIRAVRKQNRLLRHCNGSRCFPSTFSR